MTAAQRDLVVALLLVFIVGAFYGSDVITLGWVRASARILRSAALIVFVVALVRWRRARV